MPLAEPPRCDIAGIVWPAATIGPAARMLALQFQFRHTERWDNATLEAHQFRQLERLLDHCHRTMPFWRDRLRAAGWRPGQALDAASWARIPVLSRLEAQAAGAALRCLSVPASHGEIIENTTSGSTGQPLRLAKTDLHMTFWNAFLLRDMLWHRIDPRGKMAALRRDPWGDAGADQPVQAAPHRPRDLPGWGGVMETVFRTGSLHAYEIRRPADEQAEWLLREEPDYLTAFPTTVVELAQHFRDNGQRLKRLRAIRTASEAVTEAHRDLCREVFGVEMLDAYSAEEIGYIALQCPQPTAGRYPMHVMAESVKLEILGDDATPCEPGEVGRVVVTPLHNFAMPLLRYELGDYGEVGEPCACGRGLPVLNAIRGRLRHGLVMPDGSRRAVYFGINFARIPAIRQYQAAQVARDVIELRLVVRRPLTAEEEAQLAALVRNDTDPGFHVRFAYRDTIARLPNGKYEEFRCEIL